MSVIIKKVVDRQEMLKRVARFSDLQACDKGLPDMEHPEGMRTLMNVIGFSPPEDREGEVYSPVGDNASMASAIPISEGFNLGFARCKTGTGAFAHYHDTNETFIPMTGQWRFFFNEGDEQEHVDLGPYDTISMPVGVARSFINITNNADPKEENLLIYIISGDAPIAEYTPDAIEKYQGWKDGKYTSET